MVELRVVESEADLARAGADLVQAVIEQKPDAAILVATGRTPMGMYAELARRSSAGSLDTSQVRAFQLDAYLGLTEDDPRSLYGWMKRSLLDPLRITPDRVVRLRGDTPDPEAECRQYEEAVRVAGGIDLSILGLGPNGHLGFNEPPADPNAPTRVVTLTEESIASNAGYWGGREQVPARAVTAGMDILLHARRTLLLVSGAHKRDILRRTLRGPVTPDVPASFLQEALDVTVLADRAAWPGE